jgi:hypothetical protein
MLHRALHHLHPFRPGAMAPTSRHRSPWISTCAASENAFVPEPGLRLPRLPDWL